MYFISSGSVDIVSEDLKTIYATLSEGDFVGEMSLILEQPRNASVISCDYVDLFVLSKNDFDDVLKQYPEFEKHVKEIAHRRLARAQER